MFPDFHSSSIHVSKSSDARGGVFCSAGSNHGGLQVGLQIILAEIFTSYFRNIFISYFRNISWFLSLKVPRNCCFKLLLAQWHHQCYLLSRAIWDLQYNLLSLCFRMREMFKPSMAELGLCMYQVIVVAKYRTNIKSGEIMFVDFCWFGPRCKETFIQKLKSVCTKIY